MKHSNMSKFAAGAVTATMVATAVVPTAAASFTDIGKLGVGVQAEVVKAVELGFFNDAPLFNPGNQITRGQAALTLARYLSGDEGAKAYALKHQLDSKVTPFADIPVRYKDGNAYQQELFYSSLILKNAGAFTQAQLTPGGQLTRAQMAKLIVETFDLQKKDGFVSPITDIQHLHPETKGYIETIASYGITNVSKFRPTETVTRAQMASFLVRSYEAEKVIAVVGDVKDISLFVDEKIELPKTVTVTYEDASKADVAVKWNTTGIDFTKVGTYNLKGEIANTKLTASLKVEVRKVEALIAMSNTTVEVTYRDAVEDVKALTFTIEGLKVESAVVKQTDAKTVVLTTSAQEWNKEYTVKESAVIIGKFTGVSAAVPEKINTVVKSQQGVIGKEVTVSAEVTVPAGQSKAGIPVTFNINNTNPTNNNKIEVEVKTNAEGIASYTYTRYYDGVDNVIAYATHKSTIQSDAKIYWAKALQLTIKDVTEATILSNGDKKVYEIFSANNKGGVVFVAFKENIGVTPDNIEKVVHVEGNRSYTLDSQGNVTGFEIQNTPPYKTTDGSEKVIAVPVDQNGKANLVLSGTDASVTPVVYEGTFVGTSNASKADPTNYKASYDALAIQATASTIKFEKMIDYDLINNYGLKLEVEGVANAAIRNADGLGGRDYTITYTKADGKPVAANTPVYVAIPTVGLEGARFNLYDAKENRVNGAPSLSSTDYEVYQLTTDKDGKVTFHVTSDKTESYVQPIAFVNDNNPGTTGFDPKDTQVTSDVTYFVKDVTYSAGLSVNASQLAAEHEDATFKYTLVDQNGKSRAANADTDVTFLLQNGENIVTIDDITVYPHQITTFTRKLVKGAKEVAITVKAQGPTAVNVYVTSSQSSSASLPTGTKTVEFQATSIVVKEGIVNAVNKTAQTVTINGVPYSLADATYLNQEAKVPTLAAFYDHLTVGKTVSVMNDADGKLMFSVIDTTPGSVSPSVVAAVNASTTVPEVKAALQGVVGFSSILNSDQTSIATTVYGTLTTGQTVSTLTQAVAAPLAVGTTRAKSAQAKQNATVEDTKVGQYTVGSKEMPQTVFSLTQTIAAPFAVATTRAKSAQALKTAIKAAQAKQNVAVEGTEVDQYAVGSKDILQTAITAAQNMYNSVISTAVNPNARAITAARATLTTAVTTFEATKVADIRPALLTLINEAEALVKANPNAGTKPGQYANGVIARLDTAVKIAQDAYRTVGSDYATYKGALDSLQTALDTAKAAKIEVVKVGIAGSPTKIELTFSPAFEVVLQTQHFIYSANDGQAKYAQIDWYPVAPTSTAVTISVTSPPSYREQIRARDNVLPPQIARFAEFDLGFNGTNWELLENDNYKKQ